MNSTFVAVRRRSFVTYDVNDESENLVDGKKKAGLGNPAAHDGGWNYRETLRPFTFYLAEFYSWKPVI